MSAQLDLFGPADTATLDDQTAAHYEQLPASARGIEGCRCLRRRTIRRHLADSGLPASRAATGDEWADAEDLSAGVAIPGGPGACATCAHALVRHEVGGRRHCEVCVCVHYVRQPRTRRCA